MPAPHASIRPPAVAGSFYPADTATLQRTVDGLLESPAAALQQPPKALAVPHAGYVYSGSTAGRGYAALAPWATRIHRVVLLGPTHRVAVRGLAPPEAAAFATPLGNVRIDTAGVAAIAGLPQLVFSDAVHAFEHALEVQLPFLQRLLCSFTLLPLAVGDAGPAAVAEVLERVWGGPETLIVVSADLSHFLPYATAQQVDRHTCQRVLDCATDLRPDETCGAHPLNGLLLAARKKGLQPQLLAVCNSGDSAGDRQRVVGYAAFALCPATEHV